MHHLEYHLGKAEGKRFMEKNPQATVKALIEHFVEADRRSGMGITKATWCANPGNVLQVEVANPAVRGSAGSGKSFIFAWWAGALSSHADKEFDVDGITYDEQTNIARCKIVERRFLK